MLIWCCTYVIVPFSSSEVLYIDKDLGHLLESHCQQELFVCLTVFHHCYISKARFGLVDRFRECRFAECVLGSGEHFIICRVEFEQPSVCVRWSCGLWCPVRSLKVVVYCFVFRLASFGYLLSILSPCSVVVSFREDMQQELKGRLSLYALLCSTVYSTVHYALLKKKTLLMLFKC